jgi:hypothetical protein
MTDEWNDIAPPNEHEQKMGLLILFVVFVVAFLSIRAGRLPAIAGR